MSDEPSDRPAFVEIRVAREVWRLLLWALACLGHCNFSCSEKWKCPKQKTICYAGGVKSLYKNHLSVTIELFRHYCKRRKVIYNQLRADISDILKQLCSYKGVEILEGHLMPDHIHMLVSIPPKISVSSFMGYLKGKSALMIFDRHANLKYKFGNRHFWSEGYYVSTVGLNEATIKKYIQDQEKYDIMQDKLSVKEYEDPFKG